jgi:hypothetical protein
LNLQERADAIIQRSNESVIERSINKISNKFFKKNYSNYYPKILCNKENGDNLRIVLTKNNN